MLTHQLPMVLQIDLDKDIKDYLWGAIGTSTTTKVYTYYNQKGDIYSNIFTQSTVLPLQFGKSQAVKPNEKY